MARLLLARVHLLAALLERHFAAGVAHAVGHR
jgi:hypothetical protein